jgi:transposase InsO family protein
MPWIECNTMTLRKKFIEQVVKETDSVSALCLKFGISRATGYKWIRRYQKEGLIGLNDQSKRPHSFREKTEDALVDIVLTRREEFPEWGGKKLRQMLLNENVSNVPSVATINRILKAHGKISLEESIKRTKLIRFEHPKPNDLWQMDFKGHFQMKQGRCHPLTILDDHSRFALCLKAFPSEESLFVQKILEEIFMEYGLPEAMTMDNGPQWKKASQLCIWLMRIGIRIGHSAPYHPQTQGKEERFHRTLKTEVLKYRQFQNLESAQKGFDEWKEIYNFKRPHEGIGMSLPIQRYTKSPRLYHKCLPIEYGPNEIVRKVRSCGQIGYEGKNYFVGEYLSGEYVVLRPIIENCLEIYFVNTRVGRINL